MKTALFTPCYLEGVDGLGNNRLERNIAWVNYYTKIKDIVKFDNIWVLDNASSIDNLIILSERSNYKCHWITCGIHLTRSEIDYGYPYCWRALYWLKELILGGYKKIILIDSDAYVVSRRMADYIGSLNSGWTSFWVKKYGFPSAECHVLCEDAFPIFLKYCKIPWKERVGKLMEWDLPFTHINKEFDCDRYGEDDVPQTPSMDGYFQARLTRAPIFGYGQIL